MAIFEETSVNRNVHNSIGKITYCQRNGQNIVKNKIIRNTSKTLAQQQQRKKWQKKDEVAEMFFEAIEIGFPERPRTYSSYNAFVKANMNAITINEKMEVEVDYQSLLCADGKLRTPQVTVSRNMESGAYTFVPKQLSRYGKRSLASDNLYALIAEKSARDGFIAELGSREEGRETKVTIPQEWNPEEIVIYVFATDETGRKASKSAYVVPTEA